MKRRSIIALFSFLLIVGCGGSEDPAATTSEGESASSSSSRPSIPPPTKEEARALVEGSQDLAQYNFSQAAISIPMRTQMLGDQMREAIQDLDTTGWIGFDSEGNVAVSPRAMEDKRFILRQGDTLDIVPVAKKKFGEVLAVKTDASGEPSIEFSWGWEPNEIGAAFQSGYFYERYRKTYYARARLLQGVNGWQIYGIEPIDPPVPAAVEEVEEASAVE